MEPSKSQARARKVRLQIAENIKYPLPQRKEGTGSRVVQTAVIGVAEPDKSGKQTV